jgi:hypothetical protein
LLKHPLLALAIGLAALVLRLAVPAGYMPVLDHGRLELNPCPGGARIAASAAPAHGAPSRPVESHGGGSTDSGGGCAFADLAVPATGGADPFQLGAALLSRAAPGRFPAAAPRPLAALRLRPPLRGPPLPY